MARRTLSAAPIGLSGDIACSLFEDREGNIWFASEKGLDRFRKLSVSTLRITQGPSSEITKSVLATTDGSVWVAATEGFTRWKDGRPTIFGKDHGLPDIGGQSLFQDHRGRIWVSTYGGLAYFEGDRFFTVEGQPGNDVVFDHGGRGGQSLGLRPAGSCAVSRTTDPSRTSLDRAWTPSIAPGRLADGGGVWLGFWVGGGVLYFKDGKVRETYTPADGLGERPCLGSQARSRWGVVGGDQGAVSAGSRMAAFAR